ncbi:Phosphotransferase enzyme family protein [Micromonospora rhizosphaerae]|uniref:Phosphotransferase enzyme family protein n=1 Tax=Micromonospora rhizosphaerae TaxID=568872 RepID=A0A1C6SSM2_9ACTN|nr:aminoglycoside phosphotransferase family protein [Micromonospora rhizosphaerae]SCL32263.1 Phosphotransferase enzyme family protein [Micromonospora rhizosphaerae]
MTVHKPHQGVRETDGPSTSWFAGVLRQALHRDDPTVSTCRKLSRHVYRLTLATGRPASVVMKRLDPATAHRDRLLVQRWLPAVGLADIGPSLLATVSDPAGDGAWSIYEGLDGHILDQLHPDPEEVDRLVEVVASLHVRFARHPVIAEIRHHGAHLGYGAYVGHLNDAAQALTAVRSRSDVRAHLPSALLADLERVVCRAREDAPSVLALLDRVGGPDTVLHGDLWPKNVMAGPGWLRLIDWDQLGVGPAIYDLSTLLLRLPRGSRRPVLDRYLGHIAAAGWPRPTVDEVVLLSTAAERARLATLAAWRVLDILEAPTGPVAAWAGDELQSISTWWKEIDPRPEEVTATAR